jgi:hypothetical protein
VLDGIEQQTWHEVWRWCKTENIDLIPMSAGRPLGMRLSALLLAEFTGEIPLVAGLDEYPFEHSIREIFEGWIQSNTDVLTGICSGKDPHLAVKFGKMVAYYNVGAFLQENELMFRSLVNTLRKPPEVENHGA